MLVGTTVCASPTVREPASSEGWFAAASAPLTVYEAQGAAVGGKVYVFGGFYDTKTRATTRVQRYDPASDAWDTLAPLPEKVTHAGQAASDNEVFLVGGFVGDHPGVTTDHVWRYDTETNRWSALPSLPARRGGGGAALLGRTLHFFGGMIRDHDSYGGDWGDHWMLDVDTGTAWHAAAPLPNPRNHLGAVVLNGRIYAIGGQHLGDEVSGNQSSLQRWDPSTGAWSELAPLPSPRGHVSASILVRDGRILVIGGLGQGSHPLREVLEYDPGTDFWRELDPLPAPRQSPVARLIGGRVITTTGGYNGPHATTWISRN